MRRVGKFGTWVSLMKIFNVNAKFLSLFVIFIFHGHIIIICTYIYIYLLGEGMLFFIYLLLINKHSKYHINYILSDLLIILLLVDYLINDLLV